MLQMNEDLQRKYEDISLVGFPWPSLITFWKTQLYDTTQDVETKKLIRKYAHIVAHCEDKYCTHKDVLHRLK